MRESKSREDGSRVSTGLLVWPDVPATRPAAVGPGMTQRLTKAYLIWSDPGQVLSQGGD